MTYSLFMIGSSFDAADGQTLTDTYAAGDITADVSGLDQVMLGWSYTPLTGQSDRVCSLQAQFSYDGGTTWIPESYGVAGTASGGVVAVDVYENEYQLTGATGGTTYTRRLPIPVGEDSADSGVLLRVVVKEDSGSDNGVASVALYTHKI